MSDRLTFTVPPELVRAVAEELANVLEERGMAPGASGPALVDAAEIARRFGLSREWVYDHAGELGAVRLDPAGEGKKPRLRFDPELVARRIAGGGVSESEPAPPTRARRVRSTASAPLLDIKAERRPRA